VTAQAPDAPGVVLSVPPQYSKYAAKMPTHFPVIRADDMGKQTSSRTVIGNSLPDARAAGKSKFVFQLIGTQVLPGSSPTGSGVFVTAQSRKLPLGCS